MDVREIVLVVEYMGDKVEDEDVKELLRDLWSVLKKSEKVKWEAWRLAHNRKGA